MRYSELSEASLPPRLDNSIYYHGTGNDTAARSILRKGIMAPDYSKEKEHSLTPVAGRVYLTPDLGYAVIYALGGSWGSSHYDRKEMQVPYTAKTKHLWGDRMMTIGGKPARYGYVFVVPARTLTADLQPDEDEVGQLFSWILQGGPSQYYSASDHTRYDEAKSSRSMFHSFERLMKTVTTDGQRRKIKDGEYEYYAKAGKKALKKMPEQMKEWLIGLGFHLSHEGTVMPEECWKFDKRKIGWLQKDCSNFFDLADRIA